MPGSPSASARYRARNLEKVRARDRAWHAERRKRDPIPVRKAELRSWHTRKRYAKAGVTMEWFRDQLVGQAGRCAICGNVFKTKKDTHVDHSHETGEIRGLLCASCNSMLGLAHDNTYVLKTAVKYLEASLCRIEQP